MAELLRQLTSLLSEPGLTRRWRRPYRAALLCHGAAVLALTLPAASATRAVAECSDPKTALGTARTIVIDASKGGIYGSMTRQQKEPSVLNPKEVVLTFDDGPMPWVTRSILDTLDRYCAKATFFSVGRMALNHPELIKEEIARGHTVGSHTMTHPFNLPRMVETKAIAEIERGFAAVARAAGAPIAPFFRFTGLSDSAALIGYLRARSIAAFTVDIVSNDSYIPDPKRLTQRLFAAIEAHKGGIILFHDIKTVTAKALPDILAGLKERGYSVVQLTAAQPVQLLPDVMASVASDTSITRKRKDMIPFYAAVEPDRSATTAALRGYANKKAEIDGKPVNARRQRHGQRR